MLTSRLGAKIEARRQKEGNPNLWCSNLDLLKKSCPLDGVWLNDAAGLAVGYTRVKLAVSV